MSDPLWYKDAVIYEAHVRAFFDSNNDGIGDFPGLTSRLDYLQSLGINCLWLLPFYPSPLRDDGYDIADYESIHPELRDARRFRSLHGGSAQARHPGHHRARHQSHVGSASVVPGGAARACGLPRARLLRVERQQAALPGRSRSSSRTRRRRTGRGTTLPKRTTGTGSSIISRI